MRLSDFTTGSVGESRFVVTKSTFNNLAKTVFRSKKTAAFKTKAAVLKVDNH